MKIRTFKQAYKLINKGYVLTNSKPLPMKWSIYYHNQIYLTNNGYIGWQYYGSSANRNDIESLKWIVKVIFEDSIKNFQILTDEMQSY